MNRNQSNLCVLLFVVSEQNHSQTMKLDKMADESSDDNQSISSKDSPRVLVIGAGISGIRAANVLVNAGYNDVLVLEASNRTGGRIWSVDLGKFGCE